jgi:uncharacterized protein YjbI with pentapeptide repeats
VIFYVRGDKPMRKTLIVLSLFIACIIKPAYTYNPIHLKAFLVKSPYDYWDKWRKKHPHIRVDLSGAELKNFSFGSDYYNINFRGAKISNGVFADTEFIGCDFSNAVLKKMKLEQIMGYKKTFYARNSKFVNAKIIDFGFMMSCKYVNVDFSKTEFSNTTLVVSIFVNIKFQNAKFIKSGVNGYLFNCDFSGTYMEDAFCGGSLMDFRTNLTSKASIGNRLVFRNAKIINTTLYDIHNSDFRNIKTKGSALYDIHNSDFRGAYIKNTSICGEFVNINFSDSKLINCKFNKTFKGININFKNSDLNGSVFKKGSLFINVNFVNANLTNVDFSKAKFKNVIFKNADMKGAKIQRKWYNYIKRQGVRNFDKIIWVG